MSLKKVISSANFFVLVLRYSFTKFEEAFSVFQTVYAVFVVPKDQNLYAYKMVEVCGQSEETYLETWLYLEV